MSILNDFHMHTAFSEDSDAPMEAMVQRAISLGLKRICFTEHCDLDYPEECGTFLVDFSSYYGTFSRLRSAYQNQIQLLYGIEFGMQAHLASRYQEIASRQPFDFIIASQHLLHGSDPYFPKFWETQTSADVISSYFHEMLSNLKSMTTWDTLAHLDYIVRYCPEKNHGYSYEVYAESIDAILHYLIEQGKCLEVNAAGLKYGLGHPNPEESVLSRYHELGGELITIGSDAHRPEHIAYDFKKIELILKNIGFHSYTIFEARKPVQILFDQV